MSINTTHSIMGLMVTAATTLAGPPNFSIDWYTIDSGGGSSTGGTYVLRGTLGQADASGATAGGTLELAGGFWAATGTGVTPCATHGDCADLDDNGIRDDNCVWWTCNAGTCEGADIVFADMGGQFGLCPVDGTADGNDRFHALNCFANTDPGGGGGAYTCEDDPPTAFNVDAGGSFGSCAPDGVCDGNDAFAALNAFAGATSCSCPLDGAPDPSGPIEPGVVEQVALRMDVGFDRVKAGESFTVDVRLESHVDDLRGYQLHVVTLGGDRGVLELVDISVDDPGPGAKASAGQHVFSGLPYWDAYNLATRQVVVGLDDDGVPGERGGYLATLTFKASRGAAGTFMIDLLTDHADLAHRSFLFPTPAHGRIEIVETVPATVRVIPSTR